MAETNIYLIRHGQSEGNKHSLFLGHTDLDLSELGHAQAEKTAEYLNNIHADVIYSSDLLRAYNTAVHTADKKGMDIIKNKNLREIFAGKWENNTYDSLTELFGDDYKKWLNDIGNATCTDGESVCELQNRVVSEIKKIAEADSGKTILIFTHATPIRVTWAAANNTPPGKICEIPWATNASLTHIKYENGKLIPVEYSIDGHMGELSTAFPKNV